MSAVELYENAIKWHDDVWLRVMTDIPDKEAAIALLVGLDAYGMLIFEVWRPLFLEVFGINARDRRGRKHGPWKDWWSPGIVLHLECRYHKGLHRDGQYTLYDEGGDLEVRGRRWDYRREGFWEEWDREKCRMIIGKYRNDVRAGTWYFTERNSGKIGKVYGIYNDPPILPPSLPLPSRLANAKTTSYKSGGATWFYLFIRARMQHETVDIEDAVQAIAELGAAGAPFRYEATVVSPHFAASIALGWSVTELVSNRLQRVVNDLPYAARSVMTRPDGRVVVECSN